MEITIHGEASFMICNEFGDVPERGALGYYWNDTRFLCRYEMKLDGLTPATPSTPIHQVTILPISLRVKSSTTYKVRRWE